MPFKSDEDMKNYQRNYKRKLRSGADDSIKQTRETLEAEYKIRTAEDLLKLAEDVINEVMAASIDVAVKARTISALLNSAIRLVEASNTETRIKALEDKLGAGVVREISEP
jgi:hypothetical protein